VPLTRLPARLAALGDNRPLLLSLQHGCQRDLDDFGVTPSGRNPKGPRNLAAVNHLPHPLDTKSPPPRQLAGAEGFALDSWARHIAADGYVKQLQSALQSFACLRI